MSQEIYLRLGVPAQVRGLSREDWIGELWSASELEGLILGVFEGEILTLDAQSQNLESAALVLDSGIAPKGRDWIAESQLVECHIYVASVADAQAIAHFIESRFSEVQFLQIYQGTAQDWNAEWKKHFAGVEVAPFFKVHASLGDLDSQEERSLIRESAGFAHDLWIRPGSGFGTGTHETTRVCLWSLGVLREFRKIDGERILDFGSGSGILSLGAALLGAASVWGVEIDPMANENAAQNLELNAYQLVEGQVQFVEMLSDLPVGQKFDGITANILRPVLIQFAGELLSLLKPGGWLVLSGLLEGDLVRVRDAYSTSVIDWKEIQLGEWRGLIGQTRGSGGEVEWLRDLPTSQFSL